MTQASPVPKQLRFAAHIGVVAALFGSGLVLARHVFNVTGMESIKCDGMSIDCPPR